MPRAVVRRPPLSCGQNGKARANLEGAGAPARWVGRAECEKRTRPRAISVLTGGGRGRARRAVGWDGGERTGAVTEEMDNAPVSYEWAARAPQRCAFGSSVYPHAELRGGAVEGRGGGREGQTREGCGGRRRACTHRRPFDNVALRLDARLKSSSATRPPTGPRAPQGR